MYCPVCQRQIAPQMIDGFVYFVHDDKQHPADWGIDPMEWLTMMAGLQ